MTEPSRAEARAELALPCAAAVHASERPPIERGQRPLPRGKSIAACDRLLRPSAACERASDRVLMEGKLRIAAANHARLAPHSVKPVDQYLGDVVHTPEPANRMQTVRTCDVIDAEAISPSTHEWLQSSVNRDARLAVVTTDAQHRPLHPCPWSVRVDPSAPHKLARLVDARVGARRAPFMDRQQQQRWPGPQPQQCPHNAFDGTEL
mmetsp:Transcript_49836/g.112080  ORF Transcript_49836/g.112080 Transcript_49836/m.112080 type:complete len:207 (-) Transcript_49836:438-1058(-)|eukprot:CAMPEP_0181179920 /NCGR_PEP_ID=MMETSP1096-20121128/6521_1 /TAXON_ID=156174 ORGANISM="Chrysochromulina ericina, Strain CCMP281" /NCGR_SAMPLE_ID=MMETSP1096 /ASSEMBLY_ACC=CAM_ASM_000453 /LENGTH=206 /DNA_ID=CAMNT_0023268309 /DNA_START=781 /DNA_END=1401 /DNA_ORIENTATION=+